MKYFTKLLVVLALLVSFYSSKAQNTRPNLFDGFGNTITCPITEIEKIFTTASGNSLQLSLQGNFIFQGTVISAVQRYDNLKSVLVRLNNFNGALFAISKRLNADNSITYIGRIINEQYADGYELKADANGYYLYKIKLDDLLQDR